MPSRFSALPHCLSPLSLPPLSSPFHSLPCYSVPHLIFPILSTLSSNEQPGCMWTDIPKLPSSKCKYFIQQSIKVCGTSTSILLSLSHLFSSHVDLSDSTACPGYRLNKFNAVLPNLCFPEDPSPLRGHVEQNTVISTESSPDQTTLRRPPCCSEMRT